MQIPLWAVSEIISYLLPVVVVIACVQEDIDEMYNYQQINRIYSNATDVYDLLLYGGGI